MIDCSSGSTRTTSAPGSCGLIQATRAPAAVRIQTKGRPAPKLGVALTCPLRQRARGRRVTESAPDRNEQLAWLFPARSAAASRVRAKATRRRADENGKALWLDHVESRGVSRTTLVSGAGRLIRTHDESERAAARDRTVHHADGTDRLGAAVPESWATRLSELRRGPSGSLAAEPRRYDAGDPLRRPKLTRRFGRI